MSQNELNPLYQDLITYYRNHIDFIDDIYYVIISSYTLLTWRIEHVQELPYLAFIGVSGSGKTRAQECMSSICYNSINAASITRAAIYRLLDQGPVTLFCDEFETQLRSNPELLQILNSGYRRGMNVIINVPDSVSGWTPEQFNVFGPKVVSSIVLPNGPFANRCIVIPMVRNTNNINYRIDNEVADLLKNQLSTYRVNNQENILDTWGLMEESGISHRRLMELYNVILSLTPEEYKGQIIEYIKHEQKQINRSDESLLYSTIFNAVDQALKESTNNRVLIRNVVEKLRSDPTWSDDLPSHRQVGEWMSSMGYIDSFRVPDGIGRIINLRIHDSNRRRYQRDDLADV